jgi:hypothetical protein
MFEKNNSIKEILKEAKEKLSKDKGLASEKEEFNQKISKALDGNVLVLNKIHGSDSNDNIDQRSKKITEIVEHQTALLLNQEVSESGNVTLLLNNEINNEETLILNKEVADSGVLLLENEYEGPYSDELKEIHREIGELKERSEEKDPFIERIEQLEEKQNTLFNKIDQALNEIQSKDPSEEIALKFDIFNNQISNEIDEKISKVNDQNSIFEERLTQIETSSENLKNSIENLDFKIEELSNNLNESLNNNIQQQISQLEQSKAAQDQNIQNRFDAIEHQMKTNIDQMHKYLEEEKIRKEEESKRKEEEKKNDPEYQSNLRLNNIYKILEMQISQSLVNNISNQGSIPASQAPNYVSQQAVQPNQNVTTDNNKEVFEKLENLSQQLSSKVKIDDEGIKQVFQSTNEKINHLQEKLDKAISSSQNNKELIEYFKSYELKNLEGLNFDLSSIRQFDDLRDAKSFIENLIIKETQNWIKNNQKNIEEICKKIIYK